MNIHSISADQEQRSLLVPTVVSESMSPSLPQDWEALHHYQSRLGKLSIHVAPPNSFSSYWFGVHTRPLSLFNVDFYFYLFYFLDAFRNGRVIGMLLLAPPGTMIIAVFIPF